MRLAAFSGHWRIGRDIADEAVGTTGRFTGTALFRPASEGLRYREEGVIRLGTNAPLAATREYLWVDAGEDRIELRFTDGRFFHDFDARDATPCAAHDCPPDHYRVCYDFTAWPHWQAEWRVRGPRKDYRLLSVYVPAGQDVEIAASQRQSA